MRTLRNGPNDTLETNLTDDQAVTLCRTIGGAFLTSLVSKYDEFTRRRRDGRRTYALSEKQLFWLHKYALQAMNPVPVKQETVELGDLHRINTLFDTALKHVIAPKIRLNVPTTSGGEPVRIALKRVASAVSKYPGSLSVSDGAPWGRSVWYGRILMNGTFMKSMSRNDCIDDVVAILKQFAADPAKVAAAHGHLNGRCCFCEQPLTDSRSLAVGYGPICSRSWGNLPWGTEHYDVLIASKEAEAKYPPFMNDPNDDERAFDPLIQEADRLDSELAAIAKMRRDDGFNSY